MGALPARMKVLPPRPGQSALGVAPPAPLVTTLKIQTENLGLEHDDAESVLSESVHSASNSLLSTPRDTPTASAASTHTCQANLKHKPSGPTHSAANLPSPPTESQPLTSLAPGRASPPAASPEDARHRVNFALSAANLPTPPEASPMEDCRQHSRIMHSAASLPTPPEASPLGVAPKGAYPPVVSTQSYSAPAAASPEIALPDVVVAGNAPPVGPSHTHREVASSHTPSASYGNVSNPPVMPQTSLWPFAVNDRRQMLIPVPVVVAVPYSADYRRAFPLAQKFMQGAGLPEAKVVGVLRS